VTEEEDILVPSMANVANFVFAFKMM